MPSLRYHIRVVCVAHSQPVILDSLAVFFQSRAFLTYDIATDLSQSALYGRQCIDACDYVLILIGDSYGAVRGTGFSQMHLSYFNAKARAKPMIALIKRYHDFNEDPSQIHPQLASFIQVVEQQKSHVHYYDDNTDIQQLLSTAHAQIVKIPEVVTGWISAKNITPKTIDKWLKDSNAQAHQQNINKYTTIDDVTTSIELTDTLHVEYKAQAYEDGNLTDVTMTMSLTWYNVLQTLGVMPSCFSSASLQSQLNCLITAKAELDIKKLMPRVHAVSRCQIIKSDMNRLQRTLIAANWIEIKASGSEARATKELWSLTFYAKKLLEENADSNKGHYHL